MTPLNPEELEKLHDQSFLLAKRKIDQKLTGLLLESQNQLVNWIRSNSIELPENVSLNPRKIAKGENYADMPYWVSDFPASMKGKDIWTFRTVIWWGNHISFSLIIAGKFKEKIDLTQVQSKASGLYFTVASNPWKLEFSDNIAKPLEKLSKENIAQHFENHDFIKISTQENLENINKLTGLTVLSFEKLIGALFKLA